MDKAHTKSALKSAVSWSSNATGMAKDEFKERFYNKYKGTPAKPPAAAAAKENTKPLEFTLHTQQRAVKRAMFNYSVATKVYLSELHKKRVEKLQKMMEEEEIRLLRKEMVPRAQLMPLFDRPFFPQRSNRPLTVPREPSFLMCNNSTNSNSNRWSCVSANEFYHFQQAHHAWKPIK